MIKNVLLLLLCLMMSLTSISQSGYPKRIVYSGQSLIAITPHQEVMLNRAHITWKECEEVNDSLMTLIDSCKVTDSLYNRDIQGLNRVIAIQEQSITDRNNLITSQASDNKMQKKQIRKLKATKTILGISTGILAGAVLILLIL